jgi:hypothetical protein
MIARVLLKVIGVLALVVLAIVLVSFAVNLHDQPLSAETNALLVLPANPYGPDENIYISTAGFDAPAAQSVVTVGEARIREYNQSLDWSLAHPAELAAYARKTDPDKLKFSKTNDFCSSPSSSVWAESKKHRLDISALLSSNQELFQRYLALHRLRGYYETARPSHLAPFSFVPQSVRCLFLSDIADRIQTGTLQQKRAAIEDLSQDLRMWKLMMKGEGTLISKMIAAAALHRDLMVLAEAVTDPDTDMSIFEGEQGAVLMPLPATDWHIGNAFGAEFRAMVPFFKQMTSTMWAMNGIDPSRVTWWQKPWLAFQMHFFKHNATENLNARHMVRLTQLAASDPGTFSAAREEYRGWLRENDIRFSPSAIFNPIGKILVSIAGPQYEGYILRAYDVAAFQRLVYLAYQIRRQGIESRDIPTFLEQHHEWSTHPVNGTPFRWNPQSQELIVDPVGPYSGGRRFSVAVHPSGPATIRVPNF